MTPEMPFSSVLVSEPGKSQEGDPVWWYFTIVLSEINTTFYYHFVTPCSQHSSAARHRKRFFHTVRKQAMPSANPAPAENSGTFTNTRLELRESPGSLAQTGPWNPAGRRACPRSRGAPRLPRRSQADSGLPDSALPAAPARPARTASPHRTALRGEAAPSPGTSRPPHLAAMATWTSRPAASSRGRGLRAGPPAALHGTASPQAMGPPWERQRAGLQLPRGFAAAARWGTRRPRLAAGRWACGAGRQRPWVVPQEPWCLLVKR